MTRSVRQLLDAAREFHHQLSVFYTEVGEETEESRVKLL